MVVLIGLPPRNGILIVEFAKSAGPKASFPLLEAALEGARAAALPGER